MTGGTGLHTQLADKKATDTRIMRDIKVHTCNSEAPKQLVRRGWMWMHVVSANHCKASTTTTTVCSSTTTDNASSIGRQCRLTAGTKPFPECGFVFFPDLLLFLCFYSCTSPSSAPIYWRLCHTMYAVIPFYFLFCTSLFRPHPYSYISNIVASQWFEFLTAFVLRYGPSRA